MADYSRQIASALRMIAAKGVARAVIVRGGIEYPCALVKDVYDATEQDGDLIRKEDQRLVVAAGGLEIVPNSDTDTIHIIDDVHGIDEWFRIAENGIKPEAPSGVPIIYEIQARPING